MPVITKATSFETWRDFFVRELKHRDYHNFFHLNVTWEGKNLTQKVKQKLTSFARFLHQPINQLVAHFNAHISKHELKLCRCHHSILISVQQVECCTQIWWRKNKNSLMKFKFYRLEIEANFAGFLGNVYWHKNYEIQSQSWKFWELFIDGWNRKSRYTSGFDSSILKHFKVFFLVTTWKILATLLGNIRNISTANAVEKSPQTFKNCKI